MVAFLRVKAWNGRRRVGWSFPTETKTVLTLGMMLSAWRMATCCCDIVLFSSLCKLLLSTALPTCET